MRSTSVVDSPNSSSQDYFSRTFTGNIQTVLEDVCEGILVKLRFHKSMNIRIFSVHSLKYDCKMDICAQKVYAQNPRAKANKPLWLWGTDLVVTWLALCWSPLFGCNHVLVSSGCVGVCLFEAVSCCSMDGLSCQDLRTDTHSYIHTITLLLGYYSGAINEA